MNFTEKIPFKTFCQLCSDIRAADRDRKREILRDFIHKWREEAGGAKQRNPQEDCSFYPILRLLLPQLDLERGAYGVKENALAKIYIRILCLPKAGNDATKLLDYRVPKTAGSQGCDFAEVAYWILRTRCSRGEELTVGDVNSHLDGIVAKHAASDPRGVDSEFRTLLRGTSAEEQKWLIRIVLKDMKLGLSQGKILSEYHPDARDFYDSCNNLRKICDTLMNREVRLNEIGIQLFSPFRPMLSEDCDASKVDNYLKKSPYFYLETKLDGERFQLHMNQGNFKYFSRNGHDYTFTFGKCRQEGLLTPNLAKNIRSDVKNLILDGEMMCWNSSAKHFVTKGMNTDVKNLKEGGSLKPCFCVFDIVYMNDRILTNQPLNYRLKILEEVVTPDDGVVCFVDRKRISTKEEVWDSLNTAIENREEGIVMKDFISVYKPSVRKNGGWYKVKPEYTDGMMDSLDVLIVGGYFGSGRRKGIISHFLLGVAADEACHQDRKTFYSVARVGSGYTMEELAELQMRLEPHWNGASHGEMPPHIEWTREKPDLWIEPRKSFILQVKASEIIPSDSFRTGYTLRFPRVEKIRYDKSWKDCLSLGEFHEKRKAASGKLVKRDFERFESGQAVVSKNRKSPRKSVSVGSQFRFTDFGDVQCLSHLLVGKEICVFTGCGQLSKTDVEKKIVQFGGSLVQNPGANTFCVLAEEESSVRIGNVIKCGSHDVVRTSWLVQQLDLGNEGVVEVTPDALLGMSKKTRERLAALYDEYGDHYTQLSSRESLRHPFKVIEEKKMQEAEVSADEMNEADAELFCGISPYGMFRNCVAYFDRYLVLGDPRSGASERLEMAQIDFAFRGGICAESIDKSTTHVVVSIEDSSRLGKLLALNRGRRKKFHLVTEKWIQDCVREKSLADEAPYFPGPAKTKE